MIENKTKKYIEEHVTYCPTNQPHVTGDGVQVMAEKYLTLSDAMRACETEHYAVLERFDKVYAKKQDEMKKEMTDKAVKLFKEEMNEIYKEMVKLSYVSGNENLFARIKTNKYANHFKNALE